MTDVRIYHPALDRYVAVPESAVSIHRNAGWILADEVGTEAAVDSGSAGTQANGLAVPPEETTAKTTSARGRRQDKEQ